ncbi:MAG: hypothetical protein F7B60_07715 [Desulfurococcales archaeon]|nr:hypothetical protein [Desulfurococcales archaeon]
MYSIEKTHSASDCPWTYGVRSPDPRKYGIDIYGGFIVVRTPLVLPKLDHLVVVWASVSSDEYFYQTSLGYHAEWGWRISAGSCSRENGGPHPNLPCDCGCPPFKVDDKIFKPQHNHVYELGIRFIPKQGSGYRVFLYFVDYSTNILYNIYTLNDSSKPSTPVGGMMESDTTDTSDLIKVGNNNAFKIETTNWLLEPWVSERWPHGKVYADFKENEKDIEERIQIKLLSPGKFYIGYDIGGTHYKKEAQLW